MNQNGRKPGKRMIRSLCMTAAVLSAFPLAAAAGPATLLIVTRSDTNNMTTLPFTSMEECDAVADHLAMVRSENKSSLGVPGSWKRNFDDRSSFRQEVRLATICIPSASDIEKTREKLLEKGWYRDIYK
jgi:hypothetical protein